MFDENQTGAMDQQIEQEERKRAISSRADELCDRAASLRIEEEDDRNKSALRDIEKACMAIMDLEFSGSRKQQNPLGAIVRGASVERAEDSLTTLEAIIEMIEE